MIIFSINQIFLLMIMCYEPLVIVHDCNKETFIHPWQRCDKCLCQLYKGKYIFSSVEEL